MLSIAIGAERLRRAGVQSVARNVRRLTTNCINRSTAKNGWLASHGLLGACRGLVEAAPEFYPDARWQRCVVHFYRNVFSHAPNNKVAEVARMLKAIHAKEDGASALAKNAVN